MGKAVRKGPSIKWDGERGLLYCTEMNCCALMEIGGIQNVNDPFTTLVEMAVDVFIAPIMLFTSTNKHLAGDRLMDFIHDNGLGEVSFTKGVKNFTHTNNTVYLYTWIVNRKAWYKFAANINDEYTDPRHEFSWF